MPATHLEVEGVDIERSITYEGHHGEVVACQPFIRRHVLPELGRQLVEVGEDPIKVAVGGEQLRRRLLPHAWHARQVVGVVTTHRRQHRIALRLEAGPFDDARLVVEVVVAHAALVVEHSDEGVLDQLEAVSVTGDDHDGPPLVP